LYFEHTHETGMRAFVLGDVVYSSFGDNILRDIAALVTKIHRNTLIIGIWSQAMLYVRTIVSYIKPSFRFVLLNFRDDEPLDITCIRDFYDRVDGLFSTQITDECIFSGFQFLPVGLLARTPGWCYNRDGVQIIDHLLFVNFSTVYKGMPHIDTSMRVRVSEALSSNGFCQQPTMAHDEMMKIMSECQFCACPRGIGIDTHRLWESLAAGCAVVTTDWLALRCRFRGRLPAVWVDDMVTKGSVRKILDAEHYEVMDGVCVDEYGDVFLKRWADVTRERLRRLHRFVGWRRSSPLCRNIVQPSYWISRILKSASQEYSSSVDSRHGEKHTI
jgi:hypothetical protein